MKSPKISIIIPVYNAEKYLRRCVDSILSQDFTDYEILLIDDGSKDNSGNICDYYAAVDNRVKTFHKKNGGVSSARNLGLENAKGFWITFVDSDDYISSSYFKVIEKQNEDLIILQSKHLNSINGECFSQNIRPQMVTGRDNMNNFLSQNLLYHIMMTPWGKFFKHDIIGDLKFDENQKIGEDVIFVHQYLLNCKSISVANDSTYCYNNADNSDIKYSMEPEQSLVHLKNIISHYRMLKLGNLQFEAFEFGLFFSLCKSRMIGRSKVWFDDSFVKDLIKKCRSQWAFKQYVKYRLFSIPLIFNYYAKNENKKRN